MSTVTKLETNSFIDMLDDAKKEIQANEDTITNVFVLIAREGGQYSLSTDLAADGPETLTSLMLGIQEYIKAKQLRDGVVEA